MTRVVQPKNAEGMTCCATTDPLVDISKYPGGWGKNLDSPKSGDFGVAQECRRHDLLCNNRSLGRYVQISGRVGKNTLILRIRGIRRAQGVAPPRDLIIDHILTLSGGLIGTMKEAGSNRIHMAIYH